jgi:hypothetical protein
MITNFFLHDDVAYLCKILSNNKIRKSNRMYFISNGMVIFFNYNLDICIVKYKNDIVPLFVFKDEDSVGKIKKKLLEAE